MEDVKTGSHINRYEIIESVHRSELVGIFKAYDTKLERNVFLKTILHSADYSQEAVDYFLSESRLLAKISHPNIAKILDFGQEDRNLYLVSEYVPGRPLTELMTAPMPWQEAVRILLPLTEALAYAHSKGIIHRDLNPDNIIINAEEQPILSDFSLMRIIEEEETRDMTGTNVGLGSPAYISPEQGKGLTVDFRSDIYSLGVIFFEMVTGRKLFYASNSMEVVIQHVMADPPRPRSIVPSLPRTVEEIILNALSKDRNKRYQSMEQLSDALKEILEAGKDSTKKRSRSVSPRTLIGISVLGVSILAIGTMWMLRLPPFGSANASTPAPSLVTAADPLPTPTARAVTSTPGKTLPATSPTPPPGNLTVYEFPSVPVLPGRELPASSAVIDTGNLQNIVELARWGTPNINQFKLIDDNNILLAGTSAGVYYFDAADLSYQYFFDTGGSPTALTVSADEKWVVTGDKDGTVSVWNVSDGTQVYRLEHAANRIELLEISPDGSKIAFTDTNRVIHIWNLGQNLHYSFEKRHLLNINSVIFTSEGNTLISGGDDFQIYVWDVPSGKTVNNITASQKVLDLALSSDNQYLAVSLNQSNATVQIWDWRDKIVANTITGTAIITPFTFVEFLPNDQNVLTGSADGQIRVWNAFGTEKVWETPPTNRDGTPRAQSPVKTMTVSKDGTKFVVMFENGLLEIWALGDQELAVSADLRFDEVKRLAVSPDDGLFAVQSGNNAVEIISSADGIGARRLSGTLPRGSPISPNSQTLLIKSNELNVHVLSAANPTHLFTLYGYPTNGTVAYSPDGNIVTAYAGGIIKYWSTSSGLELRPGLKRTEGRCIIFYRSDDGFLTAGSEIGVIYSDANLPGFCRILRGPRTTSEEFLPDGSIIVLSTENQNVQMWDFSADGQMREIKIQSPGSVLDAALSKDGKLLAAASAAGAIEIYDLETGELLKTFELKTGPVNQIEFSSNGRYIISGSADGTVRFFGVPQMGE